MFPPVSHSFREEEYYFYDRYIPTLISAAQIRKLQKINPRYGRHFLSPPYRELSYDTVDNFSRLRIVTKARTRPDHFSDLVTD